MKKSGVRKSERERRRRQVGCRLAVQTLLDVVMSCCSFSFSNKKGSTGALGANRSAYCRPLLTTYFVACMAIF